MRVETLLLGHKDLNVLCWLWQVKFGIFPLEYDKHVPMENVTLLDLGSYRDLNPHPEGTGHVQAFALDVQTLEQEIQSLSFFLS